MFSYMSVMRWLKVDANGGKVSVIQSVKHCLINLKNFSGRASRADFLIFVSFNVVVRYIMDTISVTFNPDYLVSLLWFDWLFMLIALTMSICLLAVGVRRLHDVNRSAWWLLLGFTIVGLLWLCYWAVKPGDDDANRFGDRPTNDSL